MNKWQKKIHRNTMYALKSGTYSGCTYKQIRRAYRVSYSALEEVLRKERQSNDVLMEVTEWVML